MTRRNKYLQLTKNSAEEEIGKVIDEIRQDVLPRSLLVQLLSERHPIYTERPNYQMIRIRGYALASFSIVGLPNSALNFVLDELQNARHAYMVAAAARGIRGVKRPKPEYVTFLLQAIANIRYHDDSLDLDIFKPSWPLKNPSSAKIEIFKTFQWLRGYAKGALPELRSFLNNTIDFDSRTRKEIQKAIDCIEVDDRKLDLTCCEIKIKETNSFSKWWKKNESIKNIENLKLENQDGVSRLLKDYLNKKPTIVAFFYTRCMNPNKCTLTINKLGWLQQELLKSKSLEKVNLLAFTYDPNYDTPNRMLNFGENRGVIFGPRVHLLRTKSQDFKILSDFFRLSVNHVSSTVNQHRLELFLMDHNGKIKTSYTRLRWKVDSVSMDIEKLLQKSSRFKWISTLKNSIRQAGFPLLLAFFPKCPVCWAVYLSAFGISSLQSIPYSPWLIPCIMIAIIINLFILYRKSKVRNGLTPFWISLVGGILVLVPGYLFSNQIISILGVFLVLIGSLLNSLSLKYWSKISSLFFSFYYEIKKYNS